MQSVITCVTKPNESLFPPVRLGIQTLWVVILSLIFLGAGFFPEIKLFAQQAHYLPLHTTLEFVAMTISAMVFALAWNLRSKAENSQNMILGIGFLAVCIIDLAHTLSYDGMPDFFSINAGDKTLSFWLAGRFTAAAVFLAVALRPLTRWSQTACRSALTAAFALAGAVWWIILEHGDWLPRMYIEGQGLSDFKIGAEYLLTLIYGSASTLLWIKSRRSGNQDLLWLAAAAWVQGLAELFFSLYTGFSDLSNLLGHVYKAVAYLMVYRAIFVAGVQAPYRELAVERSRLQALLSTIPDLV